MSAAASPPAAIEGLRIGLVGPLPPPAGGMAMQTRQLADLLSGAGARVTLVQSNAPYRPAFIGRIPAVRALARLLPYLWALWRAAGRSDLFHVMANSGWSWHLFAVPAIRIARLRGVPVLVNYRGGEAAGFLARSRASVARSMAQVARLIVPSGFLQGVFGQHGMQAEVVPNIVDLARFHPAPSRPADPPHLIVARNLEPIYDNATALRALALVHARYPQARLTLAGTGPERPALEALVRELGLGGHVQFAGRLDRDAMAALLRSASIALNPSVVDNMPNSVLEALASGVPVVSTDVGGVPYIVQHDVDAWLVPARSPRAMADGILALLDDPARAQRLASAGQAAVARYSWPAVAPLLLGHYRSVLEGAKR